MLATIALLASLGIAAEIPVERFYADDPAVRQTALQRIDINASGGSSAYHIPCS